LLSYKLPGGKIHFSLEEYSDYALLSSDSNITVGFNDEEQCKPTVSSQSEPELHVVPSRAGARCLPASAGALTDAYFINCMKIVEIMVQITQNTYGKVWYRALSKSY